MKAILIMIALVSIMGCKQYKNACKKFLQPKVELLAENIAIECQCPPANIHKLFRPVAAKLCLETRRQAPNMINDQARQDSALSFLACSLIKDVVIDLTSAYATDKLECKIPLKKCLGIGKLADLIDANVCSAI